ncbi:YceI family protein [Sphingorhabdus sp.]|jgi:polyisoprenoid-binding protein YceI|uniref:YceI family protein n=1 Tax=Sphingorhabdus sp. TaxID=1902408 RepID=UPI003BAE6EBC|nr:YceI family protein [Sphingomonadales bacterium]MBK9431955.1 YceI family protein [Sphingomonadales bacterium]MBL0022326.1 YceI family protein [Sphingomonadales bacterium]
MKSKMLAAGFIILLASSAMAANSYRYRIDSSASSVDAKVSFMGIGSQKAQFPAMTGNVSMAAGTNNAFNLDVRIDARQLKAGDSTTTKRLKGPDFFDVANHPTVRFRGTRIAMNGTSNGTVSGDLTARGVTRPVTLAVNFSNPPSQNGTKEAIRLTGTTVINRKEFGMTAYSAIVGKKVTLTIRSRLIPE